MIRNGVNAPLASSCGRLFDAVAAALDICRDRQAYEGEAAARLEALVDERRCLRDEEEARLSVRHSRPARLRPALYRAARHVARDARRPDPEDAGAGDRRALPQGPRQSRRRHGRSSPSGTRRAERASTPSRCPAAASRTACCSRRSSGASNARAFACSARPGAGQ